MGKLFIAMAATLGLFSSMSSAVETVDFHLKTTQDLLDLCLVEQGATYSVEAAHYCIAYIEGAIDYHDALAADEDFSRIICYPKGVTRTEAATVLITWGKTNRTNTRLMNEAPVIGLVKAFQQEWPCQ